MKKCLKIAVLLLLLPLSLSAKVYTPASVPNPKEEGQNCYVADPDALLADSDVVFLNRCAARLYSQTEVEMSVVVLGSIGDQESFDFAYELFQRWGIGGKGKNTGVLILFAEESHDIRIMTGVGIEGVLPDAKCSRIIQEYMIPAFRQGDYGGGLCLGALQIYETCTDGEAPEELRNARSVTNRGQYATDEDDRGMSKEDWNTLIFIVALAIILIISYKREKDGHGDGGGFLSGGGSWGGGFGGGGGFSSGGGSWGGGSTMGGGARGKW